MEDCICRWSTQLFRNAGTETVDPKRRARWPTDGLWRLALIGLMMALTWPLPCVAEGSGVLGAETTQGSFAPRLKKNILLLFPYQLDLVSSTMAIGAVREEISAASDLECELFFEFFDLNRFHDQVQMERHFDLLAARFGDGQVDLVIVQSPRMLNLWLENRGRILPGAPVVYFDMSAADLAGRQYPPDVRGVQGVYDFARSVEWMLQANPSIHEIVLVHGVGKEDQRTFAHLELLKTRLDGKVLLTDISSLPFALMKERLAALPRTSAVLYLLLFEDAAGTRYHPLEALKQLAAASAVPILSGFDQLVGTGTIGGYMYSITRQAQGAARIGLRILRGEKPESIPVFSEEGNRFVFDHEALLRYDINLSSLPPDSIIKNRRYSLWELYKYQIIAVMATIAVLISLVALLAAALGRLQVARASLRRINSELESKVLERTAALELLARTDTLTGLANRRHFMELAAQEIARTIRYGGEFSLLMMDIDHFKHVNDIYGHHSGDLALQSLAKVCRSELREIDIAGRIGGEEFAVMLPQTDGSKAFRAAERLREAIAASSVSLADGAVLRFTISIGVSTLTKTETDLDTLLICADQAMYQAKDAGRNQVRMNS